MDKHRHVMNIKHGTILAIKHEVDKVPLSEETIFIIRSYE